MSLKVYTALGTEKAGPADVTNLPFCAAERATQSVPADTPTVMSLTTEVEDTDGMHDTAANQSRITIRTPGIYTIIGAIQSLTFISTATGRVTVSIRKNGTTTLDQRQIPVTAAAARSMGAEWTGRLQAGDYVELLGQVDNSGTVDLFARLTAIFEGAHAFSIQPSPVPVVTVLPTLPKDGQEVLYRFVPLAPSGLTAPTTPVLWHLKYDAAANLWLPVGAQEPAHNIDQVNRSQAFGTGWSQYTGAVLGIQTPLAGKFRARWGARAFLSGSANVNLWTGLNESVSGLWPTNGSTPPPGSLNHDHFGSAGSGLTSTYSETHTQSLLDLPANGSILWGCFPSAASTINAIGRYIELIPRAINPV